VFSRRDGETVSRRSTTGTREGLRRTRETRRRQRGSLSASDNDDSDDRDDGNDDDSDDDLVASLYPSKPGRIARREGRETGERRLCGRYHDDRDDDLEPDDADDDRSGNDDRVDDGRNNDDAGSPHHSAGLEPSGSR